MTITTNSDEVPDTIIQSQNYLSSYFVTLTSDQQIEGTKTFDTVNVSIMNVSIINVSTMDVPQIISSSLDISTNTITLNKKRIDALEIIFGSSTINSDLTEGTINFNKTFHLEPCVTISQYSTSRIVPICITDINVSNFKWASASSNVGKITWSAGIITEPELCYCECPCE